MRQSHWASTDLVPLREAAHLLGTSFGTHAALYARARRGTLYAVRLDGHWYVPQTEIRRLKRQAKAPKPRGTSTPSFDLPDPTQQAFLASLSIAKRGRAALEAQAFLRGTIRARLQRMYPNLSPQEITFKYFEEVARNG